MSGVGCMQTLLENESSAEEIEPEPGGDGQLGPVCGSGMR